MAAGKPVVAFDCDGAKEVCLDDQTGFLVNLGDLSKLALQLLRLAHEPALRQRLGRQGQQLVSERFTTDRMVDDLHHLYLRLAQNAGLIELNESTKVVH